MHYDSDYKLEDFFKVQSKVQSVSSLCFTVPFSGHIELDNIPKFGGDRIDCFGNKGYFIMSIRKEIRVIS